MCESNHNTQKKMPEYVSFDIAAEFHGHICPGLASGYQVAIAAMQALGVDRPKDEELVAIAETNACGVDAIQVVTGCTAGKGNLIIHDYAKHGFTFYCRKTDKAVRVTTCLDDFMPRREEMDVLRPKVFGGQATEEERTRFYEMMRQTSEAILQAPLDKVVRIEEVTMRPPEKARIFKSISCDCCGEMVGDEKTREIDGQRVCIPCYLKKTS